MINEVKHVLLLLHLEPNHRKRKTTRLEKKSALSQRYSYVTLASKNYSWKFCYITIEILFWSSVIVFDAGTISLVYFSVPVTSTFIELQIVSSSVWIFFSRVSLLDIFSPSFRLQLCVQFLGSMYSATSDNMKLMFARVSRCFARDSTGVLYFGWWVICKQKVWQGYQMCSVIRSDNLNRNGLRNRWRSLF